MGGLRARIIAVSVLLAASGSFAADNPGWKKAFLLTRAGDAYAKGHLPEAQKLFQAVLQVDPTDETALLHLAAIAKTQHAPAEAAALLTRGVNAHPDSFALQQELGGVLLALNKPADAAKHFEAASKLRPTQLDTWVNLGDALSLSGHREEAWAAYRTGVGIDPKSSWALRQAGFCAYDTGRDVEALEYLRAAAPSFATDFNVPLVMGHANARLGNDAAALSDYQRATQLSPKSEQGPLFTGITLARMERLDEAQRALKQAVALKPDSPIAHVHLGNLYRQLKQVDRARAQYTLALQAAPKSTWALMQLGFLELEAGKVERAKPLLQRALALDPNNADLGVALGDAYQLLHKDAEALAAYRKTLDRHPTNLAALVKAADVLRKTDLPGALQLYQRAVKLHPKSAWAHISFGDALRQNKDPAGGKEQYLAAVACDPNSPWARRQLGYVEFELGEFQQAEEQLAPLAVDGDADLWEVMGHLARRRGALDESIRWYERARAVAPDRARVLVALADALMALGDLPRAEATANQANALDPSVGPAWVLLGDIVRRRAADEQSPQADDDRGRARLAYERALKLNAADLRAARQLGTLAYELNDDATASDLLARARPAFADDGELSLVIGHVALRQKSFTAARLAYLDATGQLPNDVRPWVFAGRAALKLSKYDEAEQLFSRAIEIDPESGWAHLERGYGQRARREWEAALRSAEAATRFAPRNPQAWLFLGRLHQEKNHADEAIAAYEQARLLVTVDDPQIDRALASALTHKGQVDGLLRAETLMALPLKELSEEGYTHAIAGYLFVKLAQVSELSLPTPPVDVSRKQRREKWLEQAVTHLKEGVRLTPDDRHLRLAAAVGLSELEQFAAASEVLGPLLQIDTARCPAREEDWHFTELKAVEPPPPAKTPEQALALEETQLLSEAQLLAGDLAARGSAAQARLRYFCALAFMPSRADAHLRLGASYEAAGLTRLAEEHFLAAYALDPDNRIAKDSLARLNKEGGVPVGPIGLSGLTWLSSALVPGDVQARLAQSTGAATADAQRTFLTTPRVVGIEAEASWQKPQWGSRLRFGLGYAFSYGFNTLLNDQLTFEDRISNQVALVAQGRPRLFDDGRFDAMWRVRYRLIIANAQSRSEIRNGLELEGRLLREGWGTLSADLLYSFGLFRPGANATITDPTAHNVSFGIKVSPLLRTYQIELNVGWRSELAILQPSRRTVWVNQLQLDGLKRFGPIFAGAEVRLGQSSDSQGVDPKGALAFSVMPRAVAGFRWSGYTSVVGRTGVSIVPGISAFDSFLVGVQGEHRFVFKGLGSADQGLQLGASYDFRYTWQLQRAEHLFNLTVSLGR